MDEDESSPKTYLSYEELFGGWDELSPADQLELKEAMVRAVFKAAETDPAAARWLTERIMFENLPEETRDRIIRVANLGRN